MALFAAKSSVLNITLRVDYIINALAYMCTESTQRASRLLSSDDDNCSLSVTYKRHIFPSLWCIWHASFHHVREIGKGTTRPGRAHQPHPCEEKRQSICLIWTSCALGGRDAQRAAQWDQEETKRKALEQRPCQAIGLNIIRKKRASPELMPPSVHLWHTGLRPLTSGCTSERFTRLV